MCVLRELLTWHLVVVVETGLDKIEAVIPGIEEQRPAGLPVLGPRGCWLGVMAPGRYNGGILPPPRVRGEPGVKAPCNRTEWLNEQVKVPL